MRHVVEALEAFKNEDPSTAGFVLIENTDDLVGVPPVVSFTIQSDPIKMVGVNGLQVTDMLKYIKYLYESLNKRFSCRENALTITKIEEAIHWQDARTANRVVRGVEGENKP